MRSATMGPWDVLQELQDIVEDVDREIARPTTAGHLRVLLDRLAADITNAQADANDEPESGDDPYIWGLEQKIEELRDEIAALRKPPLTPAVPDRLSLIWEEGASAPSLLVRLQDEMARHDYGHVRVTAKELRAVLGKISVVAVKQLRKPQRPRTT